VLYSHSEISKAKSPASVTPRYVVLQLQNAFLMAFTLPNLHGVTFEHSRIPTSLFTHLNKISNLEIRHGDVLCDSHSVSVASKICTPERLLFMDGGRGYNEFSSKNLFAETPPLRLSKLKNLQVYCRPTHAKFLSEPLRTCSTTLTIFGTSL
jgi:hypothetical protein